jgi:hypothetical protein
VRHSLTPREIARLWNCLQSERQAQPLGRAWRRIGRARQHGSRQSAERGSPIRYSRIGDDQGVFLETRSGGCNVRRRTMMGADGSKSVHDLRGLHRPSGDKSRLLLFHLLSTANLRMGHSRWTRATLLVHQYCATLLTDVTITSGSRHANLHSQNLRDNGGHQVTRTPFSAISRSENTPAGSSATARHRGAEIAIGDSTPLSCARTASSRPELSRATARR